MNCVAFHPEGQLIVTGHWDSAMRIYDVWHRSRKAVSYYIFSKYIYMNISILSIARNFSIESVLF